MTVKRQAKSNQERERERLVCVRLNVNDNEENMKPVWLAAMQAQMQCPNTAH